MEFVWSVSKLSTESVDSRRELVANYVHTADATSTRQLRRVGVGDVYRALALFVRFVLGRFSVLHTEIATSSSTLNQSSDRLPKCFPDAVDNNDGGGTYCRPRVGKDSARRNAAIIEFDDKRSTFINR